MITAEIDQSELRKLVKNINRYGKHIEKQVQDEITYTAQEIRGDSINRVPVDTGRLKKSAFVNMKRNGLGAEIGHRTNYAAFVEFGTTKQKPQPYLMPAFETNTKQMMTRIKKILRNRKNKFRLR